MKPKQVISKLLANVVCRLPRDVFINPEHFKLFESRGIHCTQVHFYQPIPDTAELNEKLWTEHSTLPGIEINEAVQLALLDEFAGKYRSEYDGLNTAIADYSFADGEYGTVDAEVLYCMIRKYRPRKVIEIGSGSSTLISLKALADNEAAGAAPGEMVCVEPYPNERIFSSSRDKIRLIGTQVQEVPLSEFEALEANDILFIDSSHVSRIGSDVNYEFLEILPRLKPGVIVHVHDIYTPAEYRREWVMDRHIFWNEQYLLQAFLIGNEIFEILFAGSYLHLEHPDRLRQSFSSYSDHPRWPSCIWMRRTR